MSISMNESARYVTQQSIYDCPLLGPLTDSRISKYQKQGHYDPQAVMDRRLQVTKRKSRRADKQNILKLLEGLI
jgi:hypothetical protein